MTDFENLFSYIKNGERILLSFDSTYLVLNGEVDSRIIGTLISILLKYQHNTFTINDQMGLLTDIIEKSGMSPLVHKNISIISKKINELDYNDYDKKIFLETLKGELKQFFDTKGYLCQSSIVYFPCSVFRNLLYAYEGTSRKSFEQESFFTETIDNIISRNSINETKSIENIIILDDHLREFYIGDTHMWLSSIRQLQSKTDSTVTIACGNELFYKKVSQIFTLQPCPKINIIQLNWDALNIKSFDTIICHQNSILLLLQFYKQSPDVFLEKKIYRFAPNAEFNNLKIDYPWDINHFYKRKLGIEKKIQSIKQLKKQTHKEIYLSDEEIDAADLWLTENGYLKGNKLFILFNDSSYPEKTFSFSKTVTLIKLILSEPNKQILLFDYQDTGKIIKMKPHLTSCEYNKIIIVRGLNIRKEMAIMANIAILSIIGPCTGMMHLANGIYFELLNNKRRAKEQIPLLIVYCGSGLNVKDYHPRYWWQGAIVKCIACTKKNNLIIANELHEMPLDIEDFHNDYLPVSKIMPEHIISFLNK